ncbi:MAG: hypothetical protein AAGA15_00010 [Pseudomonadota bacterium]
MGKISVTSVGLVGVPHVVAVGDATTQVISAVGPALSISMRRGHVECAPEGIFFTANPTGFTIDRPAIGAAYEPMRHELEFRWEITGTGARRRFTRAANMPDEWRNWHTGGGHVMSRVFLPGTWTVTCIARHKRTGEIAKSQASFTVADPDTFYPPERTAIVHGGGSVAGGPAHDAGAEFVHLHEAATWARGKSGPCQVYVRSDFDRPTGRVGLTASDESLLYRVWDVDGGTPQMQYGATNTPDNNASQFDLTSGYAGHLKLWGLHLAGNWDPDTETSGPNDDENVGVGINVRSFSGAELTVLDCEISGMTVGISLLTSNTHVALESTAVTRWQDYGIFGDETSQGLYFSGTDLQLVQSSNAIMGGDKGGSHLRNNHAGIRLAACAQWALAGVDGFTADGWPPVGSLNPPHRAIQPLLRAWTGTPDGTQAGFYGHFERLSLEGGSGSLNLGPAFDGEITTSLNATIDKVLLVADCTSFVLVRIAHSGVTITNIVGMVTKLDCLQSGMWSMVSTNTDVHSTNPILGDPHALDEPVRGSGISLYSLRDSDDDNGRNVDIVAGGGDNAFTDREIGGAIRHLPNRTGKSESGPYIVISVSDWFTPRNTGPQRSVALGKETDKATNGAELGIIVPDAGSPAIGVGLGALPPSADFWGRPRKAHPDAGAVES